MTAEWTRVEENTKQLVFSGNELQGCLDIARRRCPLSAKSAIGNPGLSSSSLDPNRIRIRGLLNSWIEM